MLTEPLLKIRDLNVRLQSRRGAVHAVRDFDLEVGRGESIAIVGESGCGKSTLALSLMGLLSRRTTETTGELRFCGRNLIALPDNEFRKIRGNDIAIIFQDPMTTLNPYMTIGAQLSEQIKLHLGQSGVDAESHAEKLLESVGLPDPGTHINQYAHELSGGMRQRALIAAALSCSPQLLIADEPTTALDVTTQADILDLIRREINSRQMSLVFITHDLAVVKTLCQRVAVMYAGELVEVGTVTDVFTNPAHPYTRALLNAVPRADQSPRDKLQSIPGMPPDLRDYSDRGCAFRSRCDSAREHCNEERPELETFQEERQCRCFYAGGSLDISGANECAPMATATATVSDAEPLLSVREVTVTYDSRTSSSWFNASSRKCAVDRVSLDLQHGEILGLVGESGCGKSTLARAITCLKRIDDGEIHFQGKRIDTCSPGEFRAIRPLIQLIFQDPYASLDPRMQAWQIVGEPLINFNYGSRNDVRTRVQQLMEMVDLDPDWAQRYPHEFSGGQRQRIGIARALASEPKLIICDEPVSSLDVSIQAQILNLLRGLRDQLNLSLLFVSHDLAVIRHLAHRVMVMCEGRIVEHGNANDIFESPKADYTQKLLAAIPRL